MLSMIQLDRESANGRYARILDVLDVLKVECGSASNAAAVCIRGSARYKRALKSLDDVEQANRPRVRATKGK